MVRLTPGVPLDIALAFAPDERVPVGQLAWANRTAQLQWSREIIDGKLRVDGHVLYPPERGLVAARTGAPGGLHGFLNDSLPEGWGRLVMSRRLAKAGIDFNALTPVEHLALVGQMGRGALVFEPATTPDPEAATGIDLDAMADEAAQILSGEEGKLADILAKAAGGSGGARPKVHVGFGPNDEISVGGGELPADHTAWIVKYRANEDPIDIGPLEEAYALMADAAKLKVSEHKLIPAKKGPGYFATLRFDRPAPHQRLHMLSLAGAVECPLETPYSYDKFLRVTLQITRNAQDVERAFRRMIFNVLAHNRDDHVRQHAYLMDASGNWQLAPAYDLTYAAGPGGEHYLDIDNEGRNPTRKNIGNLGARHGIGAKDVALMVEEVASAVGDWGKFAKAAGVTTGTTKLVGDAHARVRKAF